MSTNDGDRMTRRRFLVRFRRRPVYGPPLPNVECGRERGYPSMRCDLPFGHSGEHGRVIGWSTKTGGLIESTSVTREMWS